MIRGRAGRARFTTHPRATVRDYPTPPTEEPEDPEPMGSVSNALASRRINQPADLAQLCIDAGGEARPTTGGGWLIRDKQGNTITIPRQWDHGRGKDNIIASVRKLNLDLDRADARTANTLREFNRKLPKFTCPTVDDTPGPGRPTLAYSGTPEPRTPADEAPNPQEEAPNAMTTTTIERPTPAIIPPRKVVTQEDHEAALSLIEDLSERLDLMNERLDKAEALTEARADRITTLTRRIEKLERGVVEAGGGSVYDRAKVTRERIMEWFRTLPVGTKMPTAGVTGSLDITDDGERSHYRSQLIRLAETGDLVRHGGTGVGSTPLFSLPVPGEEA